MPGEPGSDRALARLAVEVARSEADPSRLVSTLLAAAGVPVESVTPSIDAAPPHLARFVTVTMRAAAIPEAIRHLGTAAAIESVLPEPSAEI